MARGVAPAQMRDFDFRLGTDVDANGHRWQCLCPLVNLVAMTRVPFWLCSVGLVPALLGDPHVHMELAVWSAPWAPMLVRRIQACGSGLGSKAWPWAAQMASMPHYLAP